MIRKTMLAALVLLAGCSGEQPKDAGKPDGYALTMAVTAAEGGSLQRVTLPPVALVALQRPDAGDVRIFDAEAKVVALAREAPSAAKDLSSTKVAAYPIEGAEAAPGASAVSVKVNMSAEVVVTASPSGAPQIASGLSALLFDTRALADPLSAIKLDAELPAGKPVEVTLEASSDLKSWEPLGSKVLFRGVAGEPMLGSAPLIELGGPIVKDRYVRASWVGAPGIVIRGATYFTAKELPPAPVKVAAAGANLIATHEVRFTFPLGSPPRALRVTGTGSSGVVPIQLYGRASPDRPWIALSAATLRGDKPTDLDPTGASFGEYKLEADSRSAGFAAAPKIDLLFEPVVLIAAFNGKPPYTLAVGNKAAPSAYFGPGELLGDTPLSARLPEAQVAAPAGTPVVKLAPPADGGPFSSKKLALWAALLLAVGVLAFAAVRLMKAPASSPVT